MYRNLKISGGLSTVFLIILVSSISIQSPEIHGQEVDSSSGVEFLEINIEPENIFVGDSIVVYATIINNSDSPVTFQGGCDSPIWLEFLSDNVDQVLEPGCQAQSTIRIEPNQQQKVRGPSSGVLYKAVSAGTFETKVTFAYGKIEETASSATISKIIVLQINPEKEKPIVSEIPSKNSGENRIISPHKQVSSGINPQDVICSNGLQLIFKSTDNSPACVKPESVQRLIDRGWAKS